MNYKALHDYFKDVAEGMSESVQWIHNTPTYLQLYDKDKPVVLLSLPFTSSGSFDPNLNEIYVAQFIFYQKDEPDGSLDENNQEDMQATLEILAITNRVADEFMRMVDFNQISDELEASSDAITITSFTKANAIRDKEVLTGTVLTLNVSVQDSFDYCCSVGGLQTQLQGAL